MRVLLIEDHEPDHAVVERALTGCDVTIVLDEESARAAMERLQGQLDVVVIDSCLTGSDEWNTVCLLSRLRFHHSFTGRVIAVANHDHVLAEMRASGLCNDTILKEGDFGPRLKSLAETPLSLTAQAVPA